MINWLEKIQIPSLFNFKCSENRVERQNRQNSNDIIHCSSNRIQFVSPSVGCVGPT